MVAKENVESKKIFAWGEEKLTISEFEKRIFRLFLALGCEAMRLALEQADRQIAETRNKKEYRDKGYRKTVIKTLMGEVEYQRHVYLFTGESADKPTTVYLLDEAIGMSTIGHYSESVCQMAVESACETAYRHVAEFISEMTGLAISHQAAWNIVWKIGEQEQHRVEELAEDAEEQKGTGQYQTHVLYEEMDGVYLSLQGKDREINGPSKEMKVSIAYSGVSVDKNGRRRLANKVAYAGFESREDFKRHTEGVVAGYYDVSSIDRRIFNSDGGLWIQRSMVPGCTFQLDQYHRNKAVRTYVRDREKQKLILSLLREKKVDDALSVIEAYGNSTEDKTEQENFAKLYSYFKNNRHALIPYYERRKRYPETNAGQEPARCGSMESNIFTLIGNRMKHNRTVWSIAGANNLAALLVLKHTGMLGKAMIGWSLPSSWVASETVRVYLTSRQIKESVGQGYDGFKRFNSVDCPKFVKDILSFDSFF